MPQDISAFELPPNKGRAVDDVLASGDFHMSQDEFRSKRGIDKSKQVKLVKIVFMQYQHPDLDVAITFLNDFGLTQVQTTDTEVWLRGYGADQYLYQVKKGPKEFLGGAFEVESYDELVKATQLPGVKVLSDGIEEMKASPGGGYIVTLSDPEGFPISLVHGMASGEAMQPPEKIVFNDELEKPRTRKFQRFQAGPAAVFKLGHYGLVVKDFETVFDFYMRHFNFVPSSVLYLAEEGGKTTTNVGVFAHIDRGSELVDHHSIFLIALPPGHTQPHVHHCSFEIHDLDSQQMGHFWLAKKGYESVWGVGRHVLGSQIFDYWWDPNGFMVEHYIDSDVVNDQTPVSFEAAESAKDAAWGPEVPAAFLV